MTTGATPTPDPRRDPPDPRRDPPDPPGDPPDPAGDPPVTPRAALGWLNSLSIDLEAAAILDASGAVVAGDPSLTPDADRILAARSARYTVLARVGPKAMPRLVQADLHAAVQALEAG
jgi:hypothetical protein